MALKVVGSADAERLFTVVRDSGFGWTAAEVPDLLRALGWTVIDELPGLATIAQPPWDLPKCESHVTYHYRDDSVVSLRVNASAKTDDQPVERLAIADGFASLVAAATRVLGPPTSTSPGAEPTARWRRAGATLTIHAYDFVMLFDWVRNDYADSDDLLGDR